MREDDGTARLREPHGRAAQPMIALAVCLVAAACAGDRPAFRAEIVEEPLLAEPAVSAFGHCSGHGCEDLQKVGLSVSEWADIRAVFAPAAASPAEERAQIADAVARFERVVGRKTGTAEDLGGTWPGFMLSGQLDCVDETLNTQTLLRLLAAEDLLRWHRITAPAGRGSFLDGLPHRTAVLAEHDSGTEYAVDSWFYDNGREPEIVLLAQWLDGWRPASE